MECKGCYTALVTPFENGKICYSAVKDLIEEQITSGIDGLVPVGTTGESPTLSLSEHKELVKFVVENVNRRCTVIAGTGGNSTSEAVELSQAAKDDGVDATLQVAPYYNKPTQEGLYRHFATIADTVGVPIVLYNIPGRTGINIGMEVIKRLVENGNILAIKEASGSLDFASALLSETNIQVLSGDDSLTLPLIAIGANGVISVASNLIPKSMSELTHSALNGEFNHARSIHLRYYKLFSTLFIETNPIPIKAALAHAKKIREEYRLPLCPMSTENRNKLSTVLAQLNV